MRHGKDHTQTHTHTQEMEGNQKMRPLDDKQNDLQKITENRRNGFLSSFIILVSPMDVQKFDDEQKRVSSMYHLLYFVDRCLRRTTKCKISIFIPFTPECWQRMGLWHCLRRHQILRRVGYKTNLRIGLAWSERGRYPRRLNLLAFRLWTQDQNSPYLRRRSFYDFVSMLVLGNEIDIRTTLGLKVGSYFLCRSLRQSMFEKKWCALISAAPLAPRRRWGSRSRRRVKRSRAAAGTISWLGNVNGSWTIFLYISFVFSS